MTKFEATLKLKDLGDESLNNALEDGDYNYLISELVDIIMADSDKHDAEIDDLKDELEEKSSESIEDFKEACDLRLDALEITTMAGEEYVKYEEVLLEVIDKV